jgi:hypothetical protein
MVWLTHHEVLNVDPQALQDSSTTAQQHHIAAGQQRELHQSEFEAECTTHHACTRACSAFTIYKHHQSEPSPGSSSVESQAAAVPPHAAYKPSLKYNKHSSCACRIDSTAFRCCCTHAVLGATYRGIHGIKGVLSINEAGHTALLLHFGDGMHCQRSFAAALRAKDLSSSSSSSAGLGGFLKERQM